MYPRLVIDREKLRHNAEMLCRMAREHGVADLAFVTKAFSADEEMVRTIMATPCRYLADSRIENLRRFQDIGKERILLRLPMLSQVEEVVRDAEISFNSERKTLRALDIAAQKIGRVHKVVLMIDMGDLREGILFRDTEQIMAAVDTAETCTHLELYGTAFNLTCYGAVLPSEENLSAFMGITRQIEARIGRSLAFVSGGNSSSIPMLLGGRMPKGINNLRLGEAMLLGRETAYGQQIPGLFQDIATLEVEVVELQMKPSCPIGEVGRNAFGEQSRYVDVGERCRAIAAIGRQDMDCGGITPLRSGVRVIGASSDHLLLDVEDCRPPVEVGEVLAFQLNYSALLRGFTSQYVRRVYQRMSASRKDGGVAGKSVS